MHILQSHEEIRIFNIFFHFFYRFPLSHDFGVFNKFSQKKLSDFQHIIVIFVFIVIFHKKDTFF